jgi:F-type H+-transporting ATPase subunit delta
MKTSRQTQREAGKLFRLCRVNGSLDETRVRQVVQRMIAAGRPAALRVLSRFHRLVRLETDRYRAEVNSAVPLPADLRADIEAGLGRLYGPDVATSFAEDPTLIGGVRLTVGSDVYDGSVKGNLAALESRF